MTIIIAERLLVFHTVFQPTSILNFLPTPATAFSSLQEYTLACLKSSTAVLNMLSIFSYFFFSLCCMLPLHTVLELIKSQLRG